MKNIFLFLALLSAACAADRADESDGVSWRSRVAGEPRVGAEVELVVTAELPPHALVYSSDFQSDIGPQPTTLDLADSRGVELVGPVRSIAAKRKQDKTWDIELGYFEERAEFRQTVRIVRPDFVLRGRIAGQLCDEKEGTCTLFRQGIAWEVARK